MPRYSRRPHWGNLGKRIDAALSTSRRLITQSNHLSAIFKHHDTSGPYQFAWEIVAWTADYILCSDEFHSLIEMRLPGYAGNTDRYLRVQKRSLDQAKHSLENAITDNQNRWADWHAWDALQAREEEYMRQREQRRPIHLLRPRTRRAPDMLRPGTGTPPVPSTPVNDPMDVNLPDPQIESAAMASGNGPLETAPVNGAPAMASTADASVQIEHVENAPEAPATPLLPPLTPMRSNVSGPFAGPPSPIAEEEEPEDEPHATPRSEPIVPSGSGSGAVPTAVEFLDAARAASGQAGGQEATVNTVRLTGPIVLNVWGPGDVVRPPPLTPAEMARLQEQMRQVRLLDANPNPPPPAAESEAGSESRSSSNSEEESEVEESLSVLA